MKPLLSVLLCLFSLSLFSQQYTVSGKVTNSRNRQPIAFANIVVNEGQYGGISDINGKYEISTDEPIHTLTFSCLGYETLQKAIEPGLNRMNVALKSKSFQLGEVTVEAGENPAHRIIDSVMAHKKENNPNSLDSYRYNIYDQMVFTIDSSDFVQANGTAERPPAKQIELLRAEMLAAAKELRFEEAAFLRDRIRELGG